MDARATECLVALGLMGVEEHRMFPGWNTEGAVSGMFIRMLLAVLALIPADDSRRSSFTLSAYLRVLRVCSHEDWMGEILAIIQVREFPMKESFRMWVSLL